MTSNELDLFVIGAGSGGVRAARMAASAGARVAIAEERDLGGTCVNVGCIPKKLMVYASHHRDEIEDSVGFGWSGPEPTFNWNALIENKDREILRLNGIYRSLLQDAGVEILESRAVLLDPNIVGCGSQERSTKNILIATGGRPTRPEFPGNDLALISDDVFELAEQPKRIAILGGGYIAVEFANIFEGLGSKVSLLYRRELILRGFDRELRLELEGAMRARGIDIRNEVRAIGLQRRGGELVLDLDDGSTIVADQVLLATGRTPSTSGIGLRRAGVELDREGAVRVDDYSRTSAAHIWAIGDVTNRMNLTPVAIAEAMALVDTLFRDTPTAMNYRDIATAVFGQPCLSSVGLTEEEARDSLAEVDVYRSRFLPLRHTLSGRSERTLIKLLVDPSSDRVVGAHMLGPDAAEIIQGLAIALKSGATKAHFDATVGIHPTTAEEFVTMRTRAEP